MLFATTSVPRVLLDLLLRVAVAHGDSRVGWNRRGRHRYDERHLAAVGTNLLNGDRVEEPGIDSSADLTSAAVAVAPAGATYGVVHAERDEPRSLRRTPRA